MQTDTDHGWMGSEVPVFLDVRMGGSLLAKEDTAAHEGRNIADTSIIEEPQDSDS